MSIGRQTGGFESMGGMGNLSGAPESIGYPHPLFEQPDASTPFGVAFGQEFPYPQPGQADGTGTTGTSGPSGGDELH